MNTDDLENFEAERELQAQAMTDGLTGLLNRRAIEETLQAQRQKLCKEALAGREAIDETASEIFRFFARCAPDAAPPSRTFRRLIWDDTVKIFELAKKTTWVSVRPCLEGVPEKTYLGILIGHHALGASVKHDEATGVLMISHCYHNPVLWVPDLGRVVHGCESWWGQINGPDDLRQISDADITNVWYVRALNELNGVAAGVAQVGVSP